MMLLRCRATCISFLGGSARSRGASSSVLPTIAMRGVDVDLLEPNPRLVYAEQVSYEFPKVDAAVGFEKEGELVAVELVLGVDDVHWEGSLPDLGSAHFEHLLFLLELLLELDFLFFSRQPNNTFRILKDRSEAPRLVACCICRLFRELRERGPGCHDAEVLATICLDFHIGPDSNGCCAGVGMRQDEVSTAPLELDLVHLSIAVSWWPSRILCHGGGVRRRWLGSRACAAFRD